MKAKIMKMQSFHDNKYDHREKLENQLENVKKNISINSQVTFMLWRGYVLLDLLT